MKNLNAAQVKQIAKELKVKNWWNKRREDLVAEIAEAKGWSHEKPEVIEYLLAGGEIKKLPYGPENKPGIKHQESAGMKKPRKRPTKKTSTKKEKAPKAPKGDVVTLAQICEELGVEGRIARRKLRGSDIQKPGKQWEWTPGHEDIDRIKELLAK